MSKTPYAVLNGSGDVAMITVSTDGGDNGQWEILTSAGREIMEAHDRNRWRLGELLLEVQTSYGKESVKSFAYDINCRASTLYEYGRVRAAYSDDERDNLPLLTWSHFRAALKLEHETAIDALERANAEDMRVDEFREYVKLLADEPPTPRALITVEGYVCAIDVDSNKVTISLDMDADIDVWRALVNEQPAAKLAIMECVGVMA